jgi:hypothetical protein
MIGSILAVCLAKGTFVLPLPVLCIGNGSAVGVCSVVVKSRSCCVAAAAPGHLLLSIVVLAVAVAGLTSKKL